tara:strand:- start:186 stop:413 length:228 start_codon:yes stop_codon:yes gene_type:complete
MGKRKRLKGRLIRKKGLTSSEGEFRVLSVNSETDEVTMLGVYASYEEAYQEAQAHKQDGLDIYLHGDSNRVLAKV